ncbi:hypothetical protein RJ640_012938 [Escallonia rubra]|uniref:Uncharacterized protein n=1 Tax=Escallonia rubra TaxID=112253 RepID=A0AA88UJR7_9ASTE|nr:hypothetical protein RJ640_012938 [Escallonia rubra]
MGSLSVGDLSDENPRKRQMEDGHCSSSGVGVKYKPRKVSAVRDFPPGCGRNAPPVNLHPEGIAVIGESGAVNGVVESLHVEEVKGLVKEELHEGKVEGLVKDGVNEMELQGLGEAKLAILKVDLPGREEKVRALVKEEAHESGGEGDVSHEEEIQAIVPIGGAENETVLEVVVMTNAVSGDATIVDGVGLKNKFPRRRVSATRDFPPFCGRRAPRLTEEDRAGIRKKSSEVVEEADVKAGTSRGNMMCSEESEGKFREENAQKSEVKEFEPEPEPRNKSLALIEWNREDAKGPGGEVGQELVVYPYDKSPKRRSSSDAVGLGGEADKVVVQGLMAEQNCPWRSGKADLTSPDDARGRSKVKTHGSTGNLKYKFATGANKDEANHSGGKSVKKKSTRAGKGKAAYVVTGTLGINYEVDYSPHVEEQNEGSPAGQGGCTVDVSLPLYGPSCSAKGGARDRVRETLQLFHAICRKILQGEEARSSQGHGAKLRQQEKEIRRIDLLAASMIKAKRKEVNKEQTIGAVPGVEVGDEFQYRVELALVGIHRLYQAGIDSIKPRNVAVSVVASGGYDDELDNADVLIYSGQGGNPGGRDKQPEDQQLVRGNLALYNSIAAKNPVRVIRGCKETKPADSSDARGKLVSTYVYDGLYTVERYWQDVGPHGKLVFKFEMRRIPGQPELAWKEVKKSKIFKTREGLCVDDISGGKELFPICAVNTIDNQKPPQFDYITRMIYPDHYLYHLIPPEGCDCVGGCLDSKRCSCAVKNGGELPYNYNGAIVESKPLVYECGPSCNCRPSCYNRVSQHGIKIQLEIFKTQSRGWGVRSLNSISSGSFICEYTGELLEDKEAEKRTNDEYLFDIGQKCDDFSHKTEEQSKSSEVVEDGGFTIDAAQYGNVGRFINHSCSPNLYAQDVLYDHEDDRMPHIMLFAAENIPPLKELTYHYNYKVGQVRDSDGNIKTKSCYCGSTACTGRMY